MMQANINNVGRASGRFGSPPAWAYPNPDHGGTALFLMDDDNTLGAFTAWPARSDRANAVLPC